MVAPDRPEIIIYSVMRFACWITGTTAAHSEYVIIIASPRQKMVNPLKPNDL
jgi:hypothetical protein